MLLTTSVASVSLLNIRGELLARICPRFSTTFMLLRYVVHRMSGINSEVSHLEVCVLVCCCPARYSSGARSDVLYMAVVACLIRERHNIRITSVQSGI